MTKKVVTPEVVEFIRQKVTNEHLSHRDISKKLKEEKKITLSYKMVGKISRFFNFEPRKNTRRITTHVHRKKYLKRENIIEHRINYNFLENIRYIFSYFLNFECEDINRDQLELLLYLYPKYVFSKDEFYKHCKLIKVSQRNSFEELRRKRYIKVYREPKRYKALYAITEKTKVLCNRIHLACTGELDFKPSEKTETTQKLTDIIKAFRER